ncbi:alpha-amylase family protein [Pseudoxanthomonas helianthi]|nr:alpha-amylase family protein [Pseudoxanthomonas helianthi]
MRPHDTVIYQIDPRLFRDANGHGWGTLDGITEKLDYLAWLGATVIWLLPFYRSGDRDGGYDVVDHCAIDPRLGDEASFDRLVRAAERRGLRVVTELVMQHTSDRHPWFQAAQRDRKSPYRDYYIWRDQPEADGSKPIFPPIESGVWRWDAIAGQYYRHRFYAHEPDLELATPQVREEARRIMRHWLDRGVAGFRVDAIPYMVERAARADPEDGGRWLLREMNAEARRARSDPVLIGEADIAAGEYGTYLDDGRRLTHVLDFHLNNHLFLVLARQDASELARTLAEYGEDAPAARRVAWLRNNDELDLEQLSPEERKEVMDAFAPEPWMQLYHRGIRRRLAPMLDGDPQRISMTHALLFSLGQIPVLRFGDEIGVGDELEFPERESGRTPMQWHAGTHAGFTDGPAPWRKPIAGGRYGYERLNVRAQRQQNDSLLSRIRRLLHARRHCEALSQAPRIVDVGNRAVFAALFEHNGSRLLALVNVSADAQRIALPGGSGDFQVELASDVDFPDPASARLSAYGYAWLSA